MTAGDIPMLPEWLRRPHVVEWWGGDEQRPPSLEDTTARYLPSVLAPEGVAPYIAMLGDKPIGYAQSGTRAAMTRRRGLRRLRRPRNVATDRAPQRRATLQERFDGR
jgi:hypothetical protein